MSAIYPAIDPDGLSEFSVVFNDRSLNHMSTEFQGIMRQLSSTLKQVYQADAVALVPGGGTYGMEAVARQFATGKRCLVIRNGWFSYRWSQIFAMGKIPSSHTALKARAQSPAPQAPFAPPPLAEVVATIERERPDLVFAPHVETSSGILLPDDYVRAVAAATHEVGGLFVLDCIASGALWLNMRALAVDILISAPQKGWGASPGCALIMLGAEASRRIATTESTSFACDLLKWLQIMQAYEAGGHAYHATMPTDMLAHFHAVMRDMEARGFASLEAAQHSLGQKVRALLAQKGYASVAAPGFAAPGVVVCYTDDEAVHKGSAFAKLGLQTAAGVPLMCDEPPGFKTFRLGLFGIDKLTQVDATVERLRQVLDRLEVSGAP